MTTAKSLSLNLDTLEREKNYEPFVVVIADREITFTDPSEIAWQDLLEIENPVHFLRHCVSAEDKKFLLAQKMPGWKFGKLMEAYQEHYGIDTRGNGLASRI